MQENNMIDNFRNKAVRALRWSEKYTKTDMVYLAKGGSWLTGGQIISSAATFLLAIAFANLLPKEVYGTYKFVLSIAAILAIPTLQGMSTAVTQAVARGYEGTIKPALKTKLRWGTLAAVASIATAGYYFINGNTELTIAFLIAAVFLPLMDAFNLFDAYLQGKKEFAKDSRYNVYIKLISVGTLVAAVFFTGNLFIILLAYFIPYTILRYIFLQITLRKLPPNDKADGSAIGYGKHLSLMGVIGTIAGNIDKILLFHFLGAAQVAIYYFALAPVKQIQGVMKSLNPLALPKFAEHKISYIKSSVYRKIILLFLSMLLIAGVYIIVAPYVFRIFFPQYLEAVPISQLYALVLAFQVNMIFGAIFAAHARKRELYAINVFNPIARIVLYLIFIPLLGVIGAVITVLLGELVIFFAWLFLLHRAR